MTTQATAESVAAISVKDVVKTASKEIRLDDKQTEIGERGFL